MEVFFLIQGYKLGIVCALYRMKHNIGPNYFPRKSNLIMKTNISLLHQTLYCFIRSRFKILITFPEKEQEIASNNFTSKPPQLLTLDIQ